jgi:hypothetical protein
MIECDLGPLPAPSQQYTASEKRSAHPSSRARTAGKACPLLVSYLS